MAVKVNPYNKKSPQIDICGGIPDKWYVRCYLLIRGNNPILM
jgi:hypothetical protein